MKHVGLETKGTILFSSSDDDVVVTLGIEDLVIVRDGNVTLIAKKERTQDIKQVLKLLGEQSEFQDLL